MNYSEFDAKLANAVRKAYYLINSQAPHRSGNLKMNIKLVSSGNGYKIFIDTNNADYMPYTEEKWVSPRWGGRANPNEGWFKEAAELVYRMIRTELGGVSSFKGYKE